MLAEQQKSESEPEKKRSRCNRNIKQAKPGEGSASTSGVLAEPMPDIVDQSVPVVADEQVNSSAGPSSKVPLPRYHPADSPPNGHDFGGPSKMVSVPADGGFRQNTPQCPKPTSDSDDSSCTSTEELFAGFQENESRLALETIIKEQQDSIDKMAADSEALQKENAKLRALNMMLQESLVQKHDNVSFTEVKGYPNREWLLSVSQNSEDSDYLFTKELLFRLFPQGVGNATPSGRPSNNPKGRNKLEGSRELVVQPTKLDPEKVAYMKGNSVVNLFVTHISFLIFNFADRLFERRRILQDPVGIALEKSKMINKHIANVIANNPTLRKISK